MGLYQRRSCLTAACGLVALGGLAAAPVCRAQSSGKTVSIDVAKADFHAVVGMLEGQAHVEALVRDGDQPYKLVSVHLEDAPIDKALRTIAFSAGAKMSKNSDDVYVFEPEDSQSDSSQGASASTQDKQDQQESPDSKYPPGSLHYETIVLQHAVPSDILKQLRWERYIVDMDPFKPMHLEYTPPPIYSTQSNYPTMPYGYSSPSIPIGTGNEGPVSANYSSHRSADAASPDQANQFPGGFGGGGFAGGGFPGGGGGFGGGGRENGFGGGGNANPFQTQPFQPGGGGQNGRPQAQLPTGVDDIYALESINSLLVHATPEGYAIVKQIVSKLDVAPRQVEIKVEFVTASVTDVDALGVNFDLVPYPGLEVSTSQGSGSFGGVISGVSPTFLQYATGNIVAQLFQTLTRTRGKVVQAPLITTTNNVPANITIRTQIPFFTTGVVANGGVSGGTTQTSQANFLPLQTGLDVTPRINSDDSVTMNLSPQISDTTGQPSVGGIPPTIVQTLTTLRTVRSGETMVLGGLVRKQETNSSQRIPILSDIPYLGGIFRTRNKQINDQELLIFVTPTIIGDSNDASAAANTPSGQNITVTP